MGKILWGVLFIGIVFGVVNFSDKQDQKRMITFDFCTKIANTYKLPSNNSRVAFLTDCMN